MRRLHPRPPAALLGALLFAAVAAACSSGIAPGIKFGTGRNGARVTGTASSFPVDTQSVYVEVDSSHKFNATQMTVQVVQHSGSSDKVVDSGTIDIAADDNIESFPLTPATYGAGQYRIVASVNGNTIASGTVEFR